jgi:hypothetical protein
LPDAGSGEISGASQKSLSGALGKNLMDILFANQQVLDSDEHRLLMSCGVLL